MAPKMDNSTSTSAWIAKRIGNRCGKRLASLLLVSMLISNTLLPGQDWPRFRGPNGAGTSTAKNIPAKWGEADYNWKVSLPGGGNSSPVLWGKKLFVTSAEGDEQKRHLLCLDAVTGKTIWQQSFPFASFRKHKKNSTFANTTPALDEARIYVLWQSAAGSTLHALSHEGKSVWTFDLGTYKSGHGAGSSPIVYRDTVIVCNDHDADSFLIALDRETGKVRWKMPRIGDRACYSTPCVYQPTGRDPEIIFTHSFRGITGVNAETGEKNWEIDVFGTHKQRAVGSPVIFGDLVIGSSGFTSKEKNIVAVRPGANGKVKEIYRLGQQVPHVPTPLVYRQRLFLWSDQGIISCVDPAAGTTIWQDRVRGTFFSSPIGVADRIYCADQKGVITVIAASDTFEVLAQNELGEEVHATPAIGDGVIYWRSFSQIFSIGKGE